MVSSVEILLRCRSDNIDDLAVQLVHVVVCDISCVDLVVDSIAEDIPVGLGGYFANVLLHFGAAIRCRSGRALIVMTIGTWSDPIVLLNVAHLHFVAS